MKWEFPNVTGALVQRYTFARRRKSNRPYLHASVKIAHKRDFRSFGRAEISWGMQIELAWWWKPESAAGALYNWVLPSLSPPVVKSAKNPPFFLSPSKVTSRSKGKERKGGKMPQGIAEGGDEGGAERGRNKNERVLKVPKVIRKGGAQVWCNQKCNASTYLWAEGKGK